MKKIRRLLCAISLTVGATLAASVTTFAGNWGNDPAGWWFQSDNGSILVDTWKNIGGEWYYFNADGYMMTGWVKVGDEWYYCNSDGSLATDCWIDGKYYIGNDGAMLVNTTTPDGSSVDANGAKILTIAKPKISYNTNNLDYFMPDGKQFVDMGEYYIVKGALGKYELYDARYDYKGFAFKSQYEGDIYVSKDAIFQVLDYIHEGDDGVIGEVDLLTYFRLCEFIHEDFNPMVYFGVIGIEFDEDGYITRGTIDMAG